MTDKTELEVTAGDMDAAAKVSGFDTWADAVYWSNLAKQSAVQDLAQAFARHRIATRTPDPTPVAWSDEESFKHLRLLYNYTDNDSHQFTRWQMVVAMSHGMRLARQPAVPADGLVEAAQEVVDQAFRTYRARNGKDCYIEDDSGERCVIIPHESYHRLRTALAAHRGEA